MKSIVLIIPYIGKWPLWFEAHLVSIAKNPTVNWLFITDCEIPKNYAENIRFVRTTLKSLNAKINNILEIEVPLTPRKLCDVRPAYGKIFQEHIKDYDFWGFCDVDIIWGDIREFVSETILSDHDIVSSRKEAISGHFTLFKNTDEINNFYPQIPNYLNILKQKQYLWGEEQVLTQHLKLIYDSKKSPRVYWQQYLVNNISGKAHQEYYLDRWLWDDGRMINTKTGEEVMYLHFINWKRTMKFCKIKYSDNPIQFYISYNGIHYQPHSRTSRILNDFKNLFNGYYSILFRKRLVKKINKNLNKKV